jgi:adenine-specific DNA-methyltransferase
MAKKPIKKKKVIETLTHGDASRKNIPTAEYQSVMQKEEQSSIRVAYERRNRDLDPQLVWRGKDEQDWSDLVTQAPPLYIQEKVHPKVLIDDLLRQSEKATAEKDSAESGFQDNLFGDFNGLPDDSAKTEFYQHDANWSNRMILGDSLQVMASLAEREGLRGKVQCIYLDPPYGIKFNSNFQWSTTSRDVKDGKVDQITREPEQVKAFRDTWRDGIHSYLTYLRDRLTVARDLLTESGSIFVQIGDENLSRVRELLHEIFGEDNVLITIPFQKKAYQEALSLAPVNDYIVWAAKSKESLKFRPLYMPTPFEGDVGKYTRIESPELILDKSNNKESEELEALISQDWKLVREDYLIRP